MGGMAVALGMGAAILWGCGEAAADPTASERTAPSAKSTATQRVSASRQPKRMSATVKPSRRTASTARVATATPGVSVRLPQLPATSGASFTVSEDAIAGVASDYVAAGGDPTDTARFFFGDLAVSSLQSLASPDVTPDQVRTQLGNLAVSGYFGGIWLRDNLRDAPVAAPTPPSAPVDLTVSALGIGLFDAVAAGLTGAAATANPWITTTVAHASVPVLLALYGYNRGYLDVILQNPPAGVPSMQDTLSCRGFLDCSSSAFPLPIATSYDTALTDLATPDTLPWLEMAAWSKLMEITTGAGRFVWEAIARAGAFSPTSYAALVELSSDYLMVSKAAVLSSMIGAADGNADLAAASLRLQAGLWMWSGSYFSGLASNASVGTLPAIVVA